MNLQEFYDVVVIGGGPAGLTAALYLARACYRVVVVEKETFGGQITITSEVVNYPGSAPISGKALTEQMRIQAEHFAAEFLLAEVTGLDMEGDIKTVKTSKGDLHCFGVILATGAHPRMIGFKGEAEYRGHGVAYCATCDGEFFTGKEVFVLGGGFAAAEEAVFLTKYASHVTMLIREPDFTCAKAVADETRKNENITIHYNVEVEEVTGDSILRKITWFNNVTGEKTTFEPEDGSTFGVFVFAGYAPSTELVKGLCELDEFGYVVTDRQQKTSLDGLYAAGDVCIKNLRQVVTATGDGALAATELEKYCTQMQAKTGIRPVQPPVRRAALHAPVDAAPSEKQADKNELFSGDMLAQLNTVFDRMEEKLVLHVFPDNRHVSEELIGYMDSLAELTDKLSVKKEAASDAEPNARPYVRVEKEDGTETGVAFHGVPGGHEFTSFVLGLYNSSSAGQKISDESRARIASIEKDTHITVMVSLTCTMCPELVTAAQRIATLSPHVKTDVYDLNHFPDLREQYDVMSVPCFVIGDNAPAFGKKDVDQLLDLIL